MAETTIILDKRHQNSDGTYTIKLRINNNWKFQIKLHKKVKHYIY